MTVIFHKIQAKHLSNVPILIDKVGSKNRYPERIVGRGLYCLD